MFSDPHSSHFCPSEQAFPTQKDLSSVFWERSAWGSAHWLWNHLLHYDTSLPRWKVDPFLFPSFFSPLHYPLLPSTSLFISLQFWNTVPKKARPLSSHSCSSRLLKKPLVFFFFFEIGCLTYSHRLWTPIKMIREWIAQNYISFCSSDMY